MKAWQKSHFMGVALFGAHAALAQNTLRSDTLEEVVVSTQKIEQALVDVPISITVFDAAELEALRVVGSDDYLLAVPNLTYIKDNRQWGARVAIRGISGQQGGRFAPNNVMVDGIPYNLTATNALLGMRSFDIAGVEINRGPQGTLGGANSLGGTINLVTAKPDPERFSGKVTADYGRFNTSYVQGVLNTPIGDKFALRTTAYKEDSDGAVENAGPGRGDSGSDNVGARLAARWFPTERLTIDLSGSYENQSFGLDDQAYIDEWRDGPNETSEVRAETVALFEALGRSPYADPRAAFWGAGADNNGSRVIYDVSPYDRNDSTVASLQVNYDLGGHQFDFQYGTFQHSYRNAYDIDGTDVGMGVTTLHGGVDAHSAEFRVTSNYGGPLKWVAGITYHKELTDSSDVSYLSDLGYAYYLDGAAPDSLVGLGENVYDYLFYAYVGKNRIDSRAVFANVFYDFAERWHLSAGLRYTRFDASFGDTCCGESTLIEERSRDDIIDALPPVNSPSGALNEVNPRVTLNYDLSDSASAYVQFATGFRPGYANNPRIVDAGIAGSTADPEYTKNYEIGFKGAFFDERLTFAAAAFFMDYSDFQVGLDAEVSPGNFLNYTINAGSGEVMGFEIESSLTATENLEFRIGAGYTDGVINELLRDGEYIAETEIPGVRPWNAVLTGIYQQPIGKNMEATLRLDYRYQDAAWNFTFTPEDRANRINRLESWRTLDISAGVSTGRWDLAAYLENALDEEYYTSKYAGIRTVAYYIPRMFGLRFVYNFGD